MKLGAFTIEQLSEGNFEVTASGSIQRSDPAHPPAEPSSVVGIDPILIVQEHTITLLDAGIGLGLDAKGFSTRMSNLHTNLGVFGITPDQVNQVILTHLHFDHIAGLTLTDRQQQTVPTLPNAKIYVHQQEWEYALEQITQQPQTTPGIGYDLDDFYRLVADQKVVFISSDYTKISEGIEVIRSGGHTPGHLIVRVSSQGEVGYYFGDLIPNELFLNVRPRGNDLNPIESRGLRMIWLKRAHEEKAFIFFYHAIKTKFGRLARDRNRQFILTAE